MVEHVTLERRAGEAPALMQGGRVQDLWKRVGERSDAANSRGLLIRTHLCDVRGAAQKDALRPRYPAPPPARSAAPSLVAGLLRPGLLPSCARRVSLP